MSNKLLPLWLPTCLGISHSTSYTISLLGPRAPLRNSGGFTLLLLSQAPRTKPANCYTPFAYLLTYLPTTVSPLQLRRVAADQYISDADGWCPPAICLCPAAGCSYSADLRLISSLLGLLY